MTPIPGAWLIYTVLWRASSRLFLSSSESLPTSLSPSPLSNILSTNHQEMMSTPAAANLGMLEPDGGFAAFRRTNRRRQRPGSRTRRGLSNKQAISQEIASGLCVARDPSVRLPQIGTASPLLRQSFELSWARWKLLSASAEAEAKALRQVAEFQAKEASECLKRSQEEAGGLRRMFGGDETDTEDDDDVSLCLCMLGVVTYLFGDIDYDDDP